MDDLEVIRSGLAEVWESQGREFVTFEAEVRPGDGADRWVQYLDGELNVRWDFDEEPAVLLPRRGVTLPRGAYHGYSTPRGNAVIGVGDVLLDDVADLVMTLLDEVVAAGARFHVVARVERHA